MNQKKAKALRKKVGFDPDDPRKYVNYKRGFEIQALVYGKRQVYQDMKRGNLPDNFAEDSVNFQVDPQ